MDPIDLTLDDRNPLLALFERLLDLTDEERRCLDAVPVREQSIPADQAIVREGDRPTRSFIILGGIAATSKLASRGKRQITNLHIPGDMPDLHSLHIDVLDSDIRSITECRVGFMDHAALRRLCADSPRIAVALWRETLIDAAIYREWVTNLGQREAANRLGHVFCEMMLRLRAVGLSDGHSCRLPISQAVQAEVTGMSTVHVNRSLMELRREHLIFFEKGVLTIHDWRRLAEFADFDELYLHQPDKAAAAAVQHARQQDGAAA